MFDRIRKFFESDPLAGIYSLSGWQAKKDRAFKNEKLEQLCINLYKIGLRANHITLLAITLGFISLYFLYENVVVYAILFVLSCLLDAFDGLFARYTNSATKFGDILDHGGDILMPFLAYCKGFFYFNPWLMAWIVGYYVFATIYLVTGNHITRMIPTRTGMAFFALGLYPIGLLTVAVGEPLALILYIFRYSKQPERK